MREEAHDARSKRFAEADELGRRTAEALRAKDFEAFARLRDQDREVRERIVAALRPSPAVTDEFRRRTGIPAPPAEPRSAA